MAQFKKTVIFYPLCIMAIWLPCVFLGVMANRVADVPEIRAKQEARRTLATQGKAMAPAQRDELREKAAGDDVILLLLQRYAPLWLAGILGAGIMAAVMATDSQILALSTMFTEDVFAFYGGRGRFGEARAGADRPPLRHRADGPRLRRRAARARDHLRAGHPVRLLRLRRAVAAADRGALLARAARSGARSPRPSGWRWR